MFEWLQERYQYPTIPSSVFHSNPNTKSNLGMRLILWECCTTVAFKASASWVQKLVISRGACITPETHLYPKYNKAIYKDYNSMKITGRDPPFSLKIRTKCAFSLGFWLQIRFLKSFRNDLYIPPPCCKITKYILNKYIYMYNKYKTIYIRIYLTLINLNIQNIYTVLQVCWNSKRIQKTIYDIFPLPGPLMKCH